MDAEIQDSLTDRISQLEVELGQVLLEHKESLDRSARLSTQVQTLDQQISKLRRILAAG
jgi:hypothetical protein